jgi:hypothetical protein
VAAEIVIAGFHAMLTAIDIWAKERDRMKAHREFDRTYPEINTNAELKGHARRLEALAPSYVIDELQRRAERCRTDYYNVPKDDRSYSPREIDDATEAVKRCLCRELRRMLAVNAELRE